jgi:hypothetical protein
VEEVKLYVGDLGRLFVQFQDGEIAPIENYYDWIMVNMSEKKQPEGKETDRELFPPVPWHV